MDSANIDIYVGIFGPYTFIEYLELVRSKKTQYHLDELLLINLLIKSGGVQCYVKDDEVFPKEVVVMNYIEQQNEEYYISDYKILVNVLVKHNDKRVLRNLNKDIYAKTLVRIEELEKKQNNASDADIIESMTDEIDRLFGRKKLLSKWFIKHKYEADIMSPKSNKNKRTKISVMREMVEEARNDKEENALHWKKKIYELEPNSGSRSGTLSKIREEIMGKTGEKFAVGGMAWYKNNKYYYSVGRPKKKHI